MFQENRLINKKAAFLSLGCKVNSYETEMIKQNFMSYGCEIVDFKENADIYVVNTCTVTNIADRKSRQMLHRARSLNPEAVIVATGCYVQEGLDKLKEDGAVDILIGNRLKSGIADAVNSWLGKETHEMTVIMKDDQEADNEYEEMGQITAYKNARVDIKIQDGCNQFCSYCIIPYARGRISSRRPEGIVSEVRSLAEKGYKEVILTGIHLSSYGLEDYSPRVQASLRTDDGRQPLLELVERLDEIEGIERIRFGSIEPRIITENFVERLSKVKKFMPHFHLSLQSGCDTVLARMNRRYTTKEYLECCELLRKYYYKPSITTDIIVGFPGETEEEFAITEAFAEKVGFAAIHIFPYSVREGTRAARMEGQLTAGDKSQRAARLSETEARLRFDYEASFDGELRPVLVEEKVEAGGKTYYSGHTPEYILTVFESDEFQTGETVWVTMTDERVNDTILSII